MNSFRVFVPCLCSMLSAQTTGSEASQLLERVASAYEHLTRYVVRIEQTNSGAMIGGANARGGGMEPVGPHIVPANHILLARADDMLRYEISTSVFKLIWVTDGKYTWQYRDDVNSYTRTQADPSPDKPHPGLGLWGREWEFMGRFTIVAHMASKAQLLRDDIAPDRICPGPSALVQIELTQTDEPGTEQVRVDTRTDLVCESTIKWRRFRHVTPAEYTAHTVWRYEKLSGPLDIELLNSSHRNAPP